MVEIGHVIQKIVQYSAIYMCKQMGIFIYKAHIFYTESFH